MICVVVCDSSISVGVKRVITTSTSVDENPPVISMEDTDGSEAELLDIKIDDDRSEFSR